ncbi:hypothetical protein [Streptomyces mirabilis]
MGLLWNKHDVTGILTSLLDDEVAPEQMEPPRRRGLGFDQVLLSGP